MAERAVHVDTKPDGEPIWWFTPDGLLFLAEVESRGEDGNTYTDPFWSFWTPYDPLVLKFPAEEMVRAAEIHVARLKATPVTPPSPTS